jgi:hypothetical protein
MNARVQETERDAGDVESLRPGAKCEDGLRLVDDRGWTETTWRNRTETAQKPPNQTLTSILF